MYYLPLSLNSNDLEQEGRTTIYFKEIIWNSFMNE